MRSRRNFTMIEILTVIVIMSILAGIVLSVAKFARTKAQEGKTKAKLEKLEMGLEECSRDRGYFPLTGVVASGTSGTVQLSDHTDFSFTKVSTLGSWDMGAGNFRNTQSSRLYLEGYDGGEYRDAWGRPFFYRCDGNQHNKQMFDLWSAGADGTLNTEDDITNWKKN